MALLVYHEDYRIGEPGDFVWAYVPTALRLTGTTFEEVISSSFEDVISPAPDPLPTDNCPKTLIILDLYSTSIEKLLVSQCPM